MTTVILVELRKQLFRLRTYLAIGAMIAIPVIMTLAVEFGRKPRGRDTSFFALASHSGLNVPIAALAGTSSFLLVIVVSLFAGAALSEEANWGSLRYLLVRPVSRSKLLATKLIVVALLSVIATIVIPISGLVAGVTFFGWHEILSPDLTTFTQQEALIRIAISTVYVAWCMSGVIALAFMISTMTDTTLGSVAGTLGLVIISGIMNAIDSLGDIRSLLITHYWDAWEQLFRYPSSSLDMQRGALLQIPYVLVFLALAWWWFHRRDILA
ncbi:MAG: ABC transporter permease subunit [Chloroflexota bacterium]